MRICPLTESFIPSKAIFFSILAVRNLFFVMDWTTIIMIIIIITTVMITFRVCHIPMKTNNRVLINVEWRNSSITTILKRVRYSYRKTNIRKTQSHSKRQYCYPNSVLAQQEEVSQKEDAYIYFPGDYVSRHQSKPKFLSHFNTCYIWPYNVPSVYLTQHSLFLQRLLLSHSLIPIIFVWDWEMN